MAIDMVQLKSAQAKLMQSKLMQSEWVQSNQRALKIAAGVLAGVFIILLALPLFINIDKFRPKFESVLTENLGRPVSLGELSLSVLSGSVSVSDLKIADDSAFSQSPFITAKSLKVGVEMLPLVFSKELNITGIVLDEPQITLIEAANGTWNFSSLGGASVKQQPTSKESGAPQNLTIGKLEIKNGRMSIGNANSSSSLQVYDNVNAEMTNVSAKTQFPFKLKADLPGGGTAEVSGNAGPLNPSNSARTPLDATINVENLDLASSGFVGPASGVGGLSDFKGTMNSDGNRVQGVGKISIEKVKLSPKGTPAAQTVNIDYSLNADLETRSITISQGDIGIGKATAQLTGKAQTQGEAKVLNLRLNAPNMPIDELQAMLPALGFTLPSGSKLQGGTLSADLAISGTLDQLVISGPVRMSNAKLVGFDMGSKLGSLSSFGGKASSNSDTTIQNASLNARMSPQMTNADSINVTIASLGVVTGAGSVSPSGALNFSMVANLETERSEARAERKGRDDRGGIPFSIQGTTSNPTFVADKVGLAASAAGNAVQGAISKKTGGTGVAAGAVGGRLGRKN